MNDAERRLVWSAEGGPLAHYNASVQVFPVKNGSRVVGIADFLPHAAAEVVGPMMEQGMAVMKKTLDQPG
jgi:hypothetical protein